MVAFESEAITSDTMSRASASSLLGTQRLHFCEGCHALRVGTKDGLAKTSQMSAHLCQRPHPSFSHPLARPTPWLTQPQSRRSSNFVVAAAARAGQMISKPS